MNSLNYLLSRRAATMLGQWLSHASTRLLSPFCCSASSSGQIRAQLRLRQCCHSAPKAPLYSTCSRETPSLLYRVLCSPLGSLAKAQGQVTTLSFAFASLGKAGRPPTGATLSPCPLLGSPFSHRVALAGKESKAPAMLPCTHIPVHPHTHAVASSLGASCSRGCRGATLQRRKDIVLSGRCRAAKMHRTLPLWAGRTELQTRDITHFCEAQPARGVLFS